MRIQMLDAVELAQKQQGVTLLELMIATAILGIIISVAFPSFSDVGDTQRLIGATEQLTNHIQQARSEAITANRTGYINFNADGSTTWQYGISTANNNCSLAATTPTTANACVIVVDDGDSTLDPGDGTVDTGDLVLMRFTDADWGDVSLNDAITGGGSQITFDPTRGTSTSGRLGLVSGNGKRLVIAVSLLGRPSICVPSNSITTTVGNYSAC